MQAWQQEVLQSMGLSLLQPRFDFPAAVPEVQLWQSPVSQAANSAAKAVDSAVEQTAVSASSSNQTAEKPNSALAMLGGIAGIDNAEETAAETKTSSPQTATALRFRLRLVRYNHLLMLIDQPTLQWAEEQQSHAFFNDIYFALFASSPTIVQSQVFEWPPSKHYPHAQDKQQAQQTFIVFMQQMLAGVDKPIVVSWGRAADYLLDKPLAIGEYYQQAPLQLLQLHALSHYWQNSGSKRELWQQLQVIRPVH